MSAPKHTPGPWNARAQNGSVWDVGANGILVAQVLSGNTVADALLCAAAPELLDVLKTTAGNLRSIAATQPGVRTYEKWLAVVEAAIARAGGR